MGRLMTSDPKPFFEAVVQEYQDRVDAAIQCNKCGERFGVTLKGHPDGLTQDQIVARIWKVAGEKHSCEEAGYMPQKEANLEIDRVVNKYHELKHKLMRAGLIQKGKDLFSSLRSTILPGGHA